ncbi:MAG: SOS response-associated peptidase, partial [Sedimentisphaerales bacterium]|nr:SOS response-associated peptidase [Sedimentisphaerales bacterium]
FRGAKGDATMGSRQVRSSVMPAVVSREVVMCGRFTLRAPASVVAEQFAVFAMPPFTPRFNIAPTQPAPVVRMAPHRECVALRWGLIPGWAKDPAIGARLINARAETAAAKPAFRASMRRRRCLVVADGFYEWRRQGKAKQPYFIHLRDDRPFGFAGLWESWEGAAEGPLETCTILTTEANSLIAPLHDRMPVILPPDAYEAWLDSAVADPGRLAPLLRPYAGDEMAAYPVSPYVNSPAHEGEKCVEPVETFWLGREETTEGRG